jgi:hypothetical protein
MKDNRDEKCTYTVRKAPEPVDLQVVWDCINCINCMNGDKKIGLYHAFLVDDKGDTVALLGSHLTKQRLEDKLNEYCKNPTCDNVTKVRIIPIPQAVFPNTAGPFPLARGGTGIE